MCGGASGAFGVIVGADQPDKRADGLHAAIVERRLVHSGDPELDRHIANAVAKSTLRGWRLDKTDPAVEIDGAVALAMAVDRAKARAAGRSRYLGMA